VDEERLREIISSIEKNQLELGEGNELDES
jgi:hypothetical protein